MHHVIAEISVKNRPEMESELNLAVATAIRKTKPDRLHGILVTRHDFFRFTVSLTPTVPFGLIRENDQARAN